MARNENLPWDRGGSFYNGNTIDSNNLGGVNFEGKEWETEDVDLTLGGAKQARTGRDVVVRAVRNVGAAAMLPKRLARYQLTAGKVGCRVDGYTRLTSEVFAGVVDEWGPAAGFPVNDVFFIVVKGPTAMLVDLAAGANNVIAVGDILTSLTAATSGATTAGRVKPQDLTGATAVLGNEIQFAIGRAMTARTTAQTTVDILVDVACKF